MLSSALPSGSTDLVELSGNGFGCAVWPAWVAPEDRAEASSAADESGTGDAPTGAARSGTEVGAGGGAACGAGSLARGALTEVSPVNGFLYSVCGVMPSRAVGL